MRYEQLKVQCFHHKFGREVGLLPGSNFDDDRVRRLRAALIFEEACEFVVACGFDPKEMLDTMHATIDQNRGPTSPVVATGKKDFVSAVDALADILYVTLGAGVGFGVLLKHVFEIVHAANMAKTGGPTRADGKIMKPPGWRPPNIEGELYRQGWRGHDPLNCPGCKDPAMNHTLLNPTFR